MENAASPSLDATAVDARLKDYGDVVSSKIAFPFLQLPRELRDSIYDYTLAIDDDRNVRALRIERRNLKYFRPTAAAILLVLHHEYFLLNRQVAREALEVLLKNHTIYLSCGPFVLKTFLERIEEQNGPSRQWLRWIKNIELDWVTFPRLSHYPPDRDGGRDEWYWEYDQEEERAQVDHVSGAQYSGHYDEYDHEGGHYDDNFYDPSDASLYPSFQRPPAQLPDASDPFGFATHYPFTDPLRNPDYTRSSPEEVSTKLDLLVQMEVGPLFTYLASPTFSLDSVTIPLYFLSKDCLHHRSTTRPGFALPVKIRYWVQVCVHALMILNPLTSTPSTLPRLQQVKVKYLPWDIWACMNPADNLGRMVDQGVWFDGGESEAIERAGEGEAFRAVWSSLGDKGYSGRMGLQAHVRYVKWDGNVDSWRVGDELEVVFTRSGAQST